MYSYPSLRCRSISPMLEAVMSLRLCILRNMFDRLDNGRMKWTIYFDVVIIMVVVENFLEVGCTELPTVML